MRSLSIEFITGSTKAVRQHDSIMVILDRLTKVAHFISVKSTFIASDVAYVFIQDVFRAYNVQKNIVSDRDVNFTSKFWKALFAGFSTKLAFDTAYHLQTDG